MYIWAILLIITNDDKIRVDKYFYIYVLNQQNINIWCRIGEGFVLGDLAVWPSRGLNRRWLVIVQRWCKGWGSWNEIFSYVYFIMVYVQSFHCQPATNLLHPFTTPRPGWFRIWMRERTSCFICIWCGYFNKNYIKNTHIIPNPNRDHENIKIFAYKIFSCFTDFSSFPHFHFIALSRLHISLSHFKDIYSILVYIFLYLFT